MKTKRTIELMVEQSEFVFQRKARASVLAWCEGCGGQVLMITPEEAAWRTGLSVRAMYRRVEAGEIHFLEKPAGALFVCLASLN